MLSSTSNRLKNSYAIWNHICHDFLEVCNAIFYNKNFLFDFLIAKSILNKYAYYNFFAICGYLLALTDFTKLLSFEISTKILSVFMFELSFWGLNF